MADTAATRWRDAHSGAMRSRGSYHLYETFNRLDLLGPSPSPGAVDRVIGDGSYTDVPECNGCLRRGFPFVVRFGEDLGIRHSAAHLCPDCLREGALLLGALP